MGFLILNRLKGSFKLERKHMNMIHNQMNMTMNILETQLQV